MPTKKRTIAGLLWDDFQIEGASAAYASQGTYEQWASEQIVEPKNQSAAAIWNDAFRLGYLLGSGLVALGEIGQAS